MAIVVWFRRDLRVRDHLPLLEASKKKIPLIPLYVLPKAIGKAQKWWLSHSLQELSKNLKNLGYHLVIRSGSMRAVLEQLKKETGFKEIFAHRLYDEPNPALEHVTYFPGDHLVEPGDMKSYRVFTPYWKEVLKRGVATITYPLPKSGSGPSLPSESFGPIEASYTHYWNPGEESAHQRLIFFLEHGWKNYVKQRDFPSLDGTSLLSAHLHFGEISPHRVWQEVEKVSHPGDPFLRQLIWREFAYQMLHYFPQTVHEPLKDNFKKFPWEEAEEHFRLWKAGKTGFPFVDAAMRQLKETGWMHNRLRMVVGSFLVKDLFVPWQKGAKWFQENLVDADLANNTFGWQWVAGCGADAAPYFRIFNPSSQQLKFDPEGEFVKDWVDVQENLAPIVDHSIQREKALQAYARIKR